MTVRVHAVDRPDAGPHEMPDRFRHEIAYFMTPSGTHDVPRLGPREYWIRLEDAQHWLDEGVVRIVSPLDSMTKAEIELTEEQEAWLEWLLAWRVERIRLE
jgi:hypothetical protein